MSSVGWGQSRSDTREELVTSDRNQTGKATIPGGAGRFCNSLGRRQSPSKLGLVKELT